MNSIPMNTYPSFDDINDPSLSLIHLYQEPQYEDLPISLDDILSNDFLLDFADIGGVDTLTFPPSQVPPQGGLLPGDVRSFPRATSPNVPQPVTVPPFALQPTFDAFDGTYALLSHPSASHRASSSSAAFGDEEQQQAYLFGIQDLPLPTPPGPVLAPASSSSSVNRMDPVSSVAPAFGWSTGAPTPVVRTWDATAASMGHPAAATPTPGASASAEPRQVPVPRLSFPRRYPLVRVDDTIEWVRPDVMKMVIYFNFSLNAEDEAHEPWEPQV
jgi:hypothetical protein